MDTVTPGLEAAKYDHIYMLLELKTPLFMFVLVRHNPGGLCTEYSEVFCCSLKKTKKSIIISQA